MVFSKGRCPTWLLAAIRYVGEAVAGDPLTRVEPVPSGGAIFTLGSRAVSSVAVGAPEAAELNSKAIEDQLWERTISGQGATRFTCCRCVSGPRQPVLPVDVSRLRSGRPLGQNHAPGLREHSGRL